MALKPAHELVSVDLLSCAADRDLATALSAALKQRGILGMQVDAIDLRSPRPLIVLWSAALHEALPEALELDGRVRPVLPVFAPESSGPPEASALRSISWINEPGWPDGAADVLSRFLNVPPGWDEIEWEGLVTRSVAANRNGTSLTETDYDRCTDLIARRPTWHSGSAEIDEALLRSRASLRRGRRRRLIVQTAVAVLLLGVGALAIVQRSRAQAAEREAKRTQRSAESDRLGRIAIRAIGRDPDLPLLLAARAVKLHPSGEAADALSRAASAAPPHSSVPGPREPRAIVGSGDLVAVVAVDGSVLFVDLESGRTVHRIDAVQADGFPVVARSSDGERLALSYNGGHVSVRAFDPTARELWSAQAPVAPTTSSLTVAFTPDDQGLVTTWDSGPAFGLSPTDGPRPQRSPGIPSPQAVSVSEHLVAYANATRVAVARGGEVCTSKETAMSGAVSQLVLDEPNGYVYVLRVGQPIEPVPLRRACGPAGAQLREIAWPMTTGTESAALMDDGTVVAGTPAGKIVEMLAPGVYPARSYLGHTAAVTAVARLDANRLVTAGEDGWIRIWEPSTESVRYPKGASSVGGLDEAATRTKYAPSSWRSMLSVDANGHRVTTGGFASGYLAMMDRRRPQAEAASFFTRLNASIRPLSIGCGALVVDSGNTVSLVRCRGNRLVLDWTSSEGAASGPATAVTADGDRAAIATRDEVRIWRTDRDGKPKVISLSGTRNLMFGPRYSLVAVDGEGTVAIVDDSSQEPRRLATDARGHGVLAAALLPSGKQALIATEATRLLLVDLANGVTVRRLDVPGDLSKLLSIAVSPDGTEVALASRTRLSVLEIATGRLLYDRADFSDESVGEQPRDVAWLPNNAGLVYIRADEGVVEVPVAKHTSGPLTVLRSIKLPRRDHEAQLSGLSDEGLAAP